MLNDSHNTSKSLTEFRAYYLPPQIFLFNTRYETIDSLTALCLHELCHAVMGVHPLSKMVMETLTGDFLLKAGKNITLSKPLSAQNNFEEIIKHDDVHDRLPEEQLCNHFAKALTGHNYDRTWWRNRIKEVDQIQALKYDATDKR